MTHSNADSFSFQFRLEVIVVEKRYYGCTIWESAMRCAYSDFQSIYAKISLHVELLTTCGTMTILDEWRYIHCQLPNIKATTLTVFDWNTAILLQTKHGLFQQYCAICMWLCNIRCLPNNNGDSKIFFWFLILQNLIKLISQFWYNISISYINKCNWEQWLPTIWRGCF